MRREWDEGSVSTGHGFKNPKPEAGFEPAASKFKPLVRSVIAYVSSFLEGGAPDNFHLVSAKFRRACSIAAVSGAVTLTISGSASADYRYGSIQVRPASAPVASWSGLPNVAPARSAAGYRSYYGGYWSYSNPERGYYGGGYRYRYGGGSGYRYYSYGRYGDSYYGYGYYRYYGGYRYGRYRY